MDLKTHSAYPQLEGGERVFGFEWAKIIDGKGNIKKEQLFIADTHEQAHADAVNFIKENESEYLNKKEEK